MEDRKWGYGFLNNDSESYCEPDTFSGGSCTEDEIDDGFGNTVIVESCEPVTVATWRCKIRHWLSFSYSLTSNVPAAYRSHSTDGRSCLIQGPGNIVGNYLEGIIKPNLSTTSGNPAAYSYQRYNKPDVTCDFNGTELNSYQDGIHVAEVAENLHFGYRANSSTGTCDAFASGTEHLGSRYDFKYTDHRGNPRVEAPRSQNENSSCEPIGNYNDLVQDAENELRSALNVLSSLKVCT